jgi:hypothetical protein
MTVMKNDNASEQAAALIHEAIDVLQRAAKAPDSPVNEFLTAKKRRELRRCAKRLRQQRAQPRYRNLHTSEELAAIYERTVQRDEILERGLSDLKRITLALARIVDENDPEVENAIKAVAMEAKRSAEEHGPGSEASQRYHHLQLLAWFGQQSHFHHRRQRSPAPWSVPLSMDPSIEARYQMTAAESLDSLPPGEAVIAIPPENRESVRERVLLRIGVGESSWIGSFARGYANGTTVFMMPDGEHLWVSAEGAGYILDLKSRALVEEVGTEVTGVLRDDPMTVFVVNHNDMRLEAFGKTGRLWRTGSIGWGGFRQIAITDTRIIGEARQPFPPWWACFSVNLGTGEVRIGDGI